MGNVGADNLYEECMGNIERSQVKPKPRSWEEYRLVAFEATNL